MILPPDKSYNYHIPNLSDEYVRTGTQGDGDCYFHAYLRGFDFKYRHMSASERAEAVQKLRAELADHVTLESLRQISGGEYRRVLFFGALRQLLEKQNEETLVKILENTTTFKENFYVSFVEMALERLEFQTSAQKRAFVSRIKNLFLQANDLAIDTFKNQLLTAEIGATECEYISRFLKRNFLFIYETENGVERYPFCSVINENWPFCVLLWVQKSHYEVIGRKEREHASVINRVFYRGDELVEHFAPA